MTVHERKVGGRVKKADQRVFVQVQPSHVTANSSHSYVVFLPGSPLLMSCCLVDTDRKVFATESRATERQFR
jgi:hypothetical protein